MDIDSIPLAQRGLPESTYELLARAAKLSPDRTALIVLPYATRWTEPSRRIFPKLHSDVRAIDATLGRNALVWELKERS